MQPILWSKFSIKRLQIGNHLNSFLMLTKPKIGDYNSFFQRYIDLVDEGDSFTILTESLNYFTQTFKNVTGDKENYRYAEDKWTVKELIRHINDTERVMAYRALVCLRKDSATQLFYMDENFYANNSDCENLSLKDLIEEFINLRLSTISLFKNASESNLDFNVGKEDFTFTARALCYIISGHVIHHCNILKERYL